MHTQPATLRGRYLDVPDDDGYLRSRVARVRVLAGRDSPERGEYSRPPSGRMAIQYPRGRAALVTAARSLGLTLRRGMGPEMRQRHRRGGRFQSHPRPWGSVDDRALLGPELAAVGAGLPGGVAEPLPVQIAQERDAWGAAALEGTDDDA
jgi:hypothetical protein